MKEQVTWQPGGEGGEQIRVYVRLSPLLPTWNHHNTVNGLHTPIQNKQKKKKINEGARREERGGTKGITEA